MMKNYLKEKINLEQADVEQTFHITFFRFYDRKIASGEITFSQTGMKKNHFTKLCTTKTCDMTRDEIIDVCINMKLDLDQSVELLASAGYFEIE